MIKWLLVSLLLLLIFIQTFLGARLFSVAMDEQVHLPVGFVHLQSIEIEFDKSSTPFIGMLTALPGFLFSKPSINLSDQYILNNDFWNFGNKFLFSNNADQLVLWGRLVIIFLVLLLGVYVFKWAKELFGTKAGLFSLFLFAFIPVVIGHAQLISTDVGLTVFFFISSYYFWKSLTTPGVQRTPGVNQILAGVFMGMALGSKFSGVLLAPLFVLFACLTEFKTLNVGNINQKLRNFVRIVLPVFAVGFLVLWAIYFFPKNLNFYSDGLKLLYSEDANPDYLNYLNGNFKEGGWRYYFIEGFLIKTPIPLLVFIFWSLAWFRKHKITFADKMSLLLPVAFLAVSTSLSAHNIGVRYLIPIYPFLAVYSGGIVSRITNYELGNKISFKSIIHNSKFLILSMLSIWYVFSSIRVYPNQLAYFNEFVGGSDNGYKYMDDSNIDWGQDLKRLKKFIDENPKTKVVYVWRQGDRALDYYGIGKEKNIIYRKENWWAEPKGTYAVSSHFIVRAKIMSRLYSDPSLDWSSLYQPVKRIGQSLFIYEF